MRRRGGGSTTFVVVIFFVAAATPAVADPSAAVSYDPTALQQVIGRRKRGERLERLVGKFGQLFYHSHFAINKATQAAIRENCMQQFYKMGAKERRLS